MILLNPAFKSKEYYAYSGLHEISLVLPSKANSNSWQGTVDRAKSAEEAGNSTHTSDWYGSGMKNGIQIDRLGREGWPQGIKRVGDFAKDLKAQPPSGIRRKVNRGWAGQELDIHAVNAGRLPKSWISRRRQRATKYRSISIALDMGINAGTSESVLFWRGASVMRTAEALQYAGYNVEIIAFCASDGLVVGKSGRFTYSCVVKSFRAPIELSSLVFTTCSAGFFRWHIFRAFHTNKTRIYSHLGRADSYLVGAPEELARAGVLQLSGTKFIKDMSTAGAWVKEALAIVETK